jgi:hypothetical protein
MYTKPAGGVVVGGGALAETGFNTLGWIFVGVIAIAVGYALFHLSPRKGSR